MAFLQPCFIRKNTSTLREKLEEIGYKLNIYDDGTSKYLFADKTGTYISSDDIYPSVINHYFDCGDNEDLFFALAALRDDKPDYQWFLWEHNDGEYHPEEDESWRQYIPGEYWEEWW